MLINNPIITRVHTHTTRNASQNNYYINSINSNTAKMHCHLEDRKYGIEHPEHGKNCSYSDFRKYLKPHLMVRLPIRNLRQCDYYYKLHWPATTCDYGDIRLASMHQAS